MSKKYQATQKTIILARQGINFKRTARPHYPPVTLAPPVTLVLKKGHKNI